MKEPFYYGGQAVIEGVMIRGQRQVTVAVREPNGAILVHSEALPGANSAIDWRRKPFLRGIFVLWEMLVLGTRSLMFSANVALGEGDLQLGSGAMTATMGVSLAVAIGLFFVLPLALVGAIDRYIASAALSNLVEGALRLGILVGYIAGIGLLPDISRVFAYHGAEHMAVNAWEDGAKLQPVEVSRYHTAHVRCGTAFLLIVVVASVIIFALLGRPSWPLRILSRILLIPVIVALAYEFMRWGARHSTNSIVRLILAPGLLLQALTTRQPTLDQIEVAIAAIQHALAADGRVGVEEGMREQTKGIGEPSPVAEPSVLA
ncbi:MAG: DUF1385 domain-containing protein [Chloroflexi bacterium]|nr:DUF1385 domain-containing protein [Chloroflexota bacterium]